MIGQGPLSPIEEVEAKIQARIGKFLTLKQILNNLGSHPSIIIKDKASELLKAQVYLEGELAKAMKQIEGLKEGAWSFSDIGSLTSFYLSLEKQIKEVGALETEAGLNATPAGDNKNLMILLAIPGTILAATLLIKLLNKGK